MKLKKVNWAKVKEAEAQIGEIIIELYAGAPYRAVIEYVKHKGADSAERICYSDGKTAIEAITNLCHIISEQELVKEDLRPNEKGQLEWVEVLEIKVQDLFEFEDFDPPKLPFQNRAEAWDALYDEIAAEFEKNNTEDSLGLIVLGEIVGKRM